MRNRNCCRALQICSISRKLQTVTAPVGSVTFLPATGRDRLAWQGALAIIVVAILAMGPELLFGLTVTDNYRFNLLWPEQFGNLFRSYHLYPRWLPRAWEGLGAPTFYFYPPLFFWVVSVVDGITLGALGPERFVPIGTTIVLAGAGLSMRAWLRHVTTDRAALIGAIAYMIAPYHLYDIYCRGALTEAAAYASVPLVMLALARLGEGRHRYFPILAASYAILLLTHLPTALLVSVLLIPPFVFRTALRAERPVAFLVSASGGGVLGIALAAIYLVPALTLLPFVNSEALNQGFYQPDTWFFWRTPAGTMGGRMLFIIPAAVGAALLAVGAITARRENSSLFWPVLTLVVVLLVAGLFPPFWKLPGLALVQFPWRALLIVEFAAITMLASLRWRIAGSIPLAALTVLAFAYVLFGMMALHTIKRTVNEQALTASQLRQGYLDAPEYTPRGVSIHNADDPDRVRVELSNAPLVSATDPRATIKASEVADGGVAVAIESPTATVVKLRRHYFPHWHIRDAHGRDLQISPDRREQIVTFVAPAGKSSLRLQHGSAPHEELGRAISVLALLVLGFAMLWSCRAAKS